MAAAQVPLTTFNNGQKVPSVGLGCWLGLSNSENGDQTGAMVRTALKHGYRHFDTAAGYGNEEAVGKAIRESNVPREEIFVTTKYKQWLNVETVAENFNMSLEKLGLGHIDLWLMHWPMAMKNGRTLGPDDSPTFVDTWKEMEKVYEQGKVKSIGVSNFSIKTLEVLLKHAKIVPVTNQVELHPSYPQNDLLQYCKVKNIVLTGYSPLGQFNSPFFNDPTLQAVAKKEGGSVAQVLISWAVQRGTVVVPKSEREERIKDNIQLLSLSAESFGAVDDFHKGPGLHRPLCVCFLPTPGKVFGWTYEQLGWDVKWDEEENRICVA
ncbi:Aldo/keto reductase [Gautieria morchelliformis]|nr:Aldo/keto reductase [Gautieria morchelliformis]